jgi:ATP-binding cassette subfamily B protein
MTLGDIQAFIMYSRQFTQPVTQITSMINFFQSALSSAERIFEILDEKEQTDESEKTDTIKNPKGKIEFRNVTFSYTEDKPLIKNLNLTANPGDTIAIVGQTGAGKTTLVNLIMRFYEVQKGEILFDNVPIRHYKREEVRAKIGMVLQDTWLFSGTIFKNIKFGNLLASDQDIYNASKIAYVDQFVSKFPEGYKTVINEEANNISDGQKQLLTIARAFLANPNILILDEATSSVDTRTEIFVQKAMGKLMKGRTSFVIAHRLSTIKDADIILVMNEGSIVEQGNHETLLANNGVYAELYQSQFQGEQT